MPEHLTTSTDALRHVLVALNDRLTHAVADAPVGFAGFETGGGVRTPLELVGHVRRLLRVAAALWTGGEAATAALGTGGGAMDAGLDWDGELAALGREVRELDALFRQRPAPSGEVGAHRVLQGPLLDAVTHVGQLAMLRRMAGAPVEGRSYWRVAMAELGGGMPGQ